MKTEIEHLTRCKPAKTYPCLMQMKDSPETVVMFNSLTCGMIICSGSGYTTSLYRTSWNPERFEPFVGKITLTEE